MIGDVLILKPFHEQVAKKMYRQISKLKRQKKIVVTIAGESGTGKSEIAHQLRILLKLKGEKAKIFHLDNYYNTSPDERTEVRKKKGMDFVGDHEIVWEKVETHIKAFRAGKKATIPFVDLYTNEKDFLITSFKNAHVLIIEGLYATKASADLRFLIDLTYHDTKDQRVARKKEKQNYFRGKVLEKEHEAVQSHRPLVDYFIKLDKEKNPITSRLIKAK
ncbi:MAG: uridine kinase [Fibrobacteria bacterium]|nr:uridine kinase [Fibrobacteria bacterium]